MTVESCGNRERDMRDWLQTKIDNEDQKISRLAERVKAMQAYANLYPPDTQEADASVVATVTFGCASTSRSEDRQSG